MLFPIRAIERAHPDFPNVLRVDAACVYADALGVRAGHIERLDAAVCAKQMIGDTRVETITREVVLSPNQTEPRCRNDQMQVAAPSADRAIAFVHLQRARCVHLETHASTVTSTPVRYRFHGRVRVLRTEGRVQRIETS